MIRVWMAKMRCFRVRAAIAELAEDAARRLWVSHRGGLIRIGEDGAIDEWTADDLDQACLERVQQFGHGVQHGRPP